MNCAGWQRPELYHLRNKVAAKKDGPFFAGCCLRQPTAVQEAKKNTFDEFKNITLVAPYGRHRTKVRAPGL